MNFMEKKNLSIKRLTKGSIPNLPFFELKNHILGEDYSLSLVFPDRKLSIQLHEEWKGKKDPVNILSFPLSEDEGEIFITLSKARSDAKNFNHSYEDHLAFLFIHGCLHLKGMDHGDKMEEEEKKFFSLYKKIHHLQ